MTLSNLHDVQPPDCFARLGLLAAEVELVRLEMGRPAEGRARPQVAGATPREVYFVALAMARKAERLSLEVTGDVSGAVRAAPLGQVRPGHVLEVVDGALVAVQAVKQRLGMREEAKAPAREGGRQPSDCLASALAVSRQLDLLLARPMAPGNVLHLLALAAAHTARLPELPVLEHRRTPGDVYDRMLAAATPLRALLSRAGHTMLDPLPARPDATRPSDCYDLAALLLGEIAFLRAHDHDAAAPVAFDGGNARAGARLPAHCHQLAAQLEQAWKVLAHA
jgi:hypothetical protein